MSFKCEKCGDTLLLHEIRSGEGVCRDWLVYICETCCLRYNRELYSTWVKDPEWVDPKDPPPTS